MAFETIIVEIEDHVALIKLNRPDALNALSQQLIGELQEALESADANDKVRCIVITGSEKAFAAGADIKEMSSMSFADVNLSNLFAEFGDRIQDIRKPVIAAVSGYALGGGCELAMACDFI
ncbi:MAG: enoyl-CoA hydratase-related protein, partial [Pseudomonadota bacterium]|nr:enoyl-CoA hydratase-related protein [Pseudomonadota bacterium]